MAELELSVVIPALNEERAIAHCVEKAKAAIASLGAPGEVLVADNGSIDRTREIAASLGARVVPIEGKGYGRALRGGFAAAKGKYLIMADADGSYDFEQAPRYVEKLAQGSEFVVGNRFQGRIAPGAMPFLNRYLGTPVLTAVMNLLFRTGLGDVNCGMRGLTKSAFERMGLKADGMEFATEMIVKASLLKMRIAEVPCDLNRDLRDRPPHLRRWRDGWRHLRFMLLFFPTGTFLVPGTALAALGALGLAAVTARDVLAPDAAAWLGSRHILTSLLFWLMGTSVLGLGVVAQEADYQERFDAGNPIVAFLHRTFSLEKGLIIGVALIAAGFLSLLYFPLSYYAGLFPMGGEAARLDFAVIAIAAVLTGVQCVFASFALGLFYLRVEMSESHSEFYERWSAAARPYFAWQFAQFAPYVGKRVVDVGCGLGSFPEHFLAHGVDSYLGVEPDPDLRARFSERHRDPRALLAATGDATDPALAVEMTAAGIDTAFSVNVLEHIERDDLALRHMIRGTKPGGHVCLLVPAHPFLYGSLDRLDHHFRRYTKKTLRDLVARADGASVAWVDLYHFNAVAAFGWFLKGRVIKETSHGDENFSLMNAVLPFVSRAEKLVHPPFGLSLIAILRRR